MFDHLCCFPVHIAVWSGVQRGGEVSAFYWIIRWLWSFGEFVIVKMEFDDYEKLPSSNVGVHMSAGALAGIFEHIVMYPVDSVKVRPWEKNYLTLG